MSQESAEEPGAERDKCGALAMLCGQKGPTASQTVSEPAALGFGSELHSPGKYSKAVTSF